MQGTLQPWLQQQPRSSASPLQWFKEAKWGSFRPAGRKGGTPSGKGPGRVEKGKPGAKKAGKRPAGNAGGGGGGDDDRTALNLAYIVMAYMAYSFLSDMYAGSMGRVEKIDYQTFRNDILARDMVDKVRLLFPLSSVSLCCLAASHPQPSLHAPMAYFTGFESRGAGAVCTLARP